jgi:hypothetical protein
MVILPTPARAIISAQIPPTPPSPTTNTFLDMRVSMGASPSINCVLLIQYGIINIIFLGIKLVLDLA